MADDKVVDMADAIRARLAAEDAAPRPANINAPQKEAVPPPKDFAFVLKDESGQPGITINLHGYLIISSVFIGCGTLEGVITGVVPIDNVLYVNEVDATPPAQVA